MKKLLITYRMANATENVESCIVLPMEDRIADELLTHGDEGGHFYGGPVHQALTALAKMQGYQFDCSALSFEEAE